MIHGYGTTLPVPVGMASTWDPELVEKAAGAEANEGFADGVRWTFSPMVDISRDSRWGRIIESAGEDPYLDSVMARAYVRGYQGKKLNAPGSIAACPKHYVGYGAVEGGRDYNTVEISEHTLREVYLPPFYAALDEGEAVGRVLRVKFALGLFENPYTDEKLANPDGPLPKENLQLARTAAEESFVLLKNEARGGRATLPLAKEVGSVALIGPLGDDAAQMLGSWAGRGRPQDVVTVKTALNNALGAEHVKFVKGGDIRSASDAQIEEA